MLSQSQRVHLQEEIGKHLQIPSEIQAVSPISGGDINAAYRLELPETNLFVKSNSATRFPGMFVAEQRGLDLLRANTALRVPETHFVCEFEGNAFLVMEFVQQGAPSADMSGHFGAELAKLHRSTQEEFGLDHNNYIGSLPQSNTFHKTWVDFFINERLEPQLQLARKAGYYSTKLESSYNAILKRLPDIFPTEPPALLHGDLWGGNYITGPDGNVCFIDPAVYYGHREMDIGMSRLFGGFSTEFYRAYNEEYSLEPGWQDRIDIANLYPLLVHVNLFSGGGYLSQVERILSRFC